MIVAVDYKFYKGMTIVFMITSFMFMGMYVVESGEFLFWEFDSPLDNKTKCFDDGVEPLHYTENYNCGYELGREMELMKRYPSPALLLEAVENGEYNYKDIPKRLKLLMEYEK